jgi:hypothetical protein
MAKGKLQERQQREAVLAAAKSADIPGAADYSGRSAAAGRVLRNDNIEGASDKTERKEDN